MDLTPLPSSSLFSDVLFPRARHTLTSIWITEYQMYTLYIRLRGRGRGGVMMVTVVFFSSPPAMSGGHFIFFPRWSEEQKLFLYSYILPSTTSTTVNWAEVKQFSTITCIISYIVPACSNISKLIFNNDQALLLLVQNYDYLQTDLNSKYICVVNEELQLHQYVPIRAPL